MTKFALTILGVNSATPAHGRFPTSQVLQVQHQFFLIDCGEGTQMRMADFKVPRHKIHHIFISHLHGDHVFGLPGLLLSYALNDRKAPLHIFSPPGLEEMVLAQLMPGDMPTFSLQFHPLDTQQFQLVLESNLINVYAFPLRHRIPTVGFLFKEKERLLNIRPEKIKEYQLSIAQIKTAKAGHDITLNNGHRVPNSELTIQPPPPRSFAFVSDTAFDDSIVPYIKKVDLLYHETTFCHALAQYAKETFHSTTCQAATIAKMAQVGKLITGHYSSRYIDLTPFLEETSAIFPNTELGLEGNVYEVPVGRLDS